MPRAGPTAETGGELPHPSEIIVAGGVHEEVERFHIAMEEMRAEVT